MDADTVRQSLARFIGIEKAKRFIKAGLRRNGTLHYWQQDIWDQLIAANPAFADAAVLLSEVFRFCVLHDCELKQDSIGVIHGCVDHVPEYDRDAAAFFPWAAIGPWSTEGRSYEGNTIQVWYCPGCRDAFKESRWGRPQRDSS